MPKSPEKLKSELVVLYQEMADLTLPECRSCKVPLSCCSSEYCQMTMEYAKNEWGVELVTTNHDRLPLMGESGCTASPHLRPWCTMHTCAINGLGMKFDDPDFNKAYFSLRRKIETKSMKVGM